MKLGKKIKEMRKEKDWTLEELSEKSDVCASTLSDYESADDGKISNLKKIAKAFNVPIDELIDENYVQINTCNDNQNNIQINININVNAQNEDQVAKIIETVKPLVKK